MNITSILKTTVEANNIQKKPTRHSSCKHSTRQQVSTSQNDGKGNTLDVPEYRVIGSAIITHLDLGKKVTERTGNHTK